MLINLSNHPHSTWSEQQRQAAVEQFGELMDLPFPDVDPSCNEEQIDTLAKDYLSKIKKLALHHQVAAIVHLMGEYTFTFALASKLKLEGIDVLVSTSERHSVMNADGTKTIRFEFVQFRRY